MKISALTELAMMQLAHGLSYNEVMPIAMDVPALGRASKLSLRVPREEIHFAFKKPSYFAFKKPSFKTGDRVLHLKYGPGTIVEEWGSWFSCRECLEELKAGEECICGGLTQHVSGRGIFSVRFDSGIEAINKTWLEISA